MNRLLPSARNYVGLSVFLGCFVLIGLDRAITQADQFTVLRPIAITLYEWTILLSAFGLVAGGASLAWAHFQRIRQGGPDWFLSLTLLIVLTTIVTLGLLDPSGTTSPIMEWTVSHVIKPVQATLFALLALYLMAAAYRFLRFDKKGGGWILFGVVVMLLVQMPLSQELVPESIEDFLVWFVEWPTMAAMRGAILGVSLGLLVAAARFMLKQL